MSSQYKKTNDTSQQPMREHNINAIVEYYLSGIKAIENSGNVGLELEHFIVRNDLSPVAYRGNTGVAHILENLRKTYPVTTYDESNNILGVSRPEESITIEPAAQIELSAGPFSDLNHARAVYDAFEQTLKHELSSLNAQAITAGYHPSARARDLELIPKQRYQFMNSYLSKTGTCGPCMMRGSAATQVTIDYFSEKDCLRKLRLAFAMTPILSLICDNSPVFEGSPRTMKLVRTHIWNNMDNDRCGLVPDVLSNNFSLERYAAYILDTPAILVQNATTGEWVADNRTFGEIYANAAMTRKDIEHALSMFFTDIRLKTYIEIRPADALPVPYAIAYAALLKGLFYHEANLDYLDELFTNVSSADFTQAKQSLMNYGYQAIVYGRPVYEYCDTLIALAHNGLSTAEQDLLRPLSRLIEYHTTLADISEQYGFYNVLCSDEDVAEITTHAKNLHNTTNPTAALPDNTNKMVTVTFRGFFDDGHTFLDQTHQAIEFPCIHGWMPPEIVDAVTTMLPGETKTVRAEAHSVYQERSEDRIISIERSKLPAGTTFETGTVVHLEGLDGQTYPARVIEQTDTHICFDTNHDAVGKALNFQITLHAVSELR